MPGETAVIIEDDPTMLRVLKDNFTFDGFGVTAASDGEAGLEAVLNLRPDLVVLDIMLPKINGYEVCRLVRKEGLEMPVIMLTAKAQEQDVVLGLNLGADDYVTKPFSMRELLARARAFLRRRRQAEAEVYRFGDCELNLTSRKLFRNGEELPLTPKEFGLLALFIRQPGRALTRDQIMNAVWGYDVLVTSRSVDRFVNTLRAKIEPDAHQPAFIQTVREIGYRFEGMS